MRSAPALALAAATVCLLLAATIPTIDWMRCVQHQGGMVCRVAAGAAREAWAGTSATLLGIAYQQNRRS